MSAAWSDNYLAIFLTSMIDFDVLYAVVFHVLRDGIVARFVATDGGITRVYPRRYRPLCLPTFSSRFSSVCCCKILIIKALSKYMMV